MSNTKKILKDSPLQGLSYIKPSSDLAPKEVRGKYVHKARVRAENEALPREYHSREIYDGAELRPFEGRPGAMDFKKCPSRGF